MAPESPQQLELFKQFMAADSLADILDKYQALTKSLKIRPTMFEVFYSRIKSLAGKEVTYKQFFEELEEKVSNRIYLNEKKERDALRGQNCLIIGGTANGLRTAIELQLLGAARVLVVDKRENFLSNQHVHLWSYVLNDLKQLGGRRVLTGLDPLPDHIPLRKLELSLLKIALTLGCEFVAGVQFEEICPLCVSKIALSDECFCNLHLTTESANQTGAFAHFKFSTNDIAITSRLHSFTINILIDAGERSNYFNQFFAKKELKDKPTIVIRCSFQYNSQQAVIIPASSLNYVDCKDHPHLFAILREITNGIDLVSYCMYRDETISFVFTPKKQSLLSKGVLIENKSNDKELFHPDNINKTELLNYARSSCVFLTGLVDVKFATKTNGEPDCSINDFTTLFASENACCIKDIIIRPKCCRKTDELKNDQLLFALVGDSLQATPWSLLGSKIGRGFFSAYDAAFLARQYGLKVLGSKLPKNECEAKILDVITERESVYKFLSQITPESISPNFQLYTIDPSTRYPNLKLPPTQDPGQYKHLLHAKLIT